MSGTSPDRTGGDSLAALFLRFLRFGCLAFGGPVAQIAMIRAELVDRERWITPERFNRLFAVLQALPGPEAHELCVHLGVGRRGRLGGLLAGLGFMLPGFVLMMALAAAYVAFAASLEPWRGVFLAVQAATLGIILRALFRIGSHAVMTWGLGGVAAACLIGSLAGAPFWILLVTAGAVHGLWSDGRRGWAALAVIVGAGACAVVMAIWPSAPDFTATELFGAAQGTASALLLFGAGLKAGLLTFGGAYTAIPFLRQDLVGRGWIADGQFLDGVALAGLLPAPLIIFGTFAGYVAGGPVGAVAITAGIFLPAFAFSMLFHDRLEQVVEAPAVRHILDGIAAGAVGLIAAALMQLGVAVAGQTPSLGMMLALTGSAAVILWTWNSRFAAPAVLAAAALAGWLFWT